MMPHEPTMAPGIPESPSARALVMKGILQEQLGPINDFEFRGIWRLSRQRMLNHPRGPQAHGIPENNMIQAIWSHFFLKVRQGKGNIKGVPWVEINKRAGSTGFDFRNTTKPTDKATEAASSSSVLHNMSPTYGLPHQPTSRALVMRDILLQELKNVDEAEFQDAWTLVRTKLKKSDPQMKLSSKTIEKTAIQSVWLRLLNKHQPTITPSKPLPWKRIDSNHETPMSGTHAQVGSATQIIWENPTEMPSEKQMPLFKFRALALRKLALDNMERDDSLSFEENFNYAISTLRPNPDIPSRRAQEESVLDSLWSFCFMGLHGSKFKAGTVIALAEIDVIAGQICKKPLSNDVYTIPDATWKALNFVPYGTAKERSDTLSQSMTSAQMFNDFNKSSDLAVQRYDIQQNLPESEPTKQIRDNKLTATPTSRAFALKEIIWNELTGVSRQAFDTQYHKLWVKNLLQLRSHYGYQDLRQDDQERVMIKYIWRYFFQDGGLERSIPWDSFWKPPVENVQSQHREEIGTDTESGQNLLKREKEKVELYSRSNPIVITKDPRINLAYCRSAKRRKNNVNGAYEGIEARIMFRRRSTANEEPVAVKGDECLELDYGDNVGGKRKSECMDHEPDTIMLSDTDVEVATTTSPTARNVRSPRRRRFHSNRYHGLSTEELINMEFDRLPPEDWAVAFLDAAMAERGDVSTDSVLAKLSIHESKSGAEPKVKQPPLMRASIFRQMIYFPL